MSQKAGVFLEPSGLLCGQVKAGVFLRLIDLALLTHRAPIRSPGVFLHLTRLKREEGNELIDICTLRAGLTLKILPLTYWTPPQSSLANAASIGPSSAASSSRWTFDGSAAPFDTPPGETGMTSEEFSVPEDFVSWRTLCQDICDVGVRNDILQIDR